MRFKKGTGLIKSKSLFNQLKSGFLAHHYHEIDNENHTSTRIEDRIFLEPIPPSKALYYFSLYKNDKNACKINIKET